MKCLHICNDLLGSKVYFQLYEQLDINNIEQLIFHPLRDKNKNNLSKFKFQLEGSKIFYSDVLKTRHRLFLREKTRFLLNNLEQNINLENVQIIHATTLFSDGAIAFKLYKKHRIPYIVTVRNTDIGVFLKFRPDLYLLGLNILTHASKIIFITDSLQTKFYQNFFIKYFKAKLINKSQVIYNGIDQFWINNKPEQKNHPPNQILYVGSFLERKNTLSLIKSIMDLRLEIPELRINIVGKHGKQEKAIIHLAKQHPDIINYIGPIYKKTELLQVYRNNHIFAMPSFNETFGLVYIEALSQGLPVVYSKEEGIDGVFKEKIGESVNPSSSDSIKNGISKIINDYDHYNLKVVDINQFSWQKISNSYINLYQSII